METRRIVRLTIVIVALGAPSVAAAGQSGRQAAEPIEIDSGFLIFEGNYIPPPYRLRAENGKTYINDLEVSPVRRGSFGGRSFGMRRMNLRPTSGVLERLEQHLGQDGMLLCTPTARTVFVPVEQAVAILNNLLADQPREAKLQLLQEVVPPWSARGSWVPLVDVFEAPTELVSRLQTLKSAQAEPDPVEARAEQHWTMLSALTMTGFALSVWALGTLLSCRPPRRRGWRGVNPSRAYCRQVVWLVVLIVVLNVYDLLCTLFVNGTGGLWELNPFADELVGETAMIVTFKIALTVGAATLLLVTRRHKLAQVGSWWVGVLYTVLIARWAIFNSMFM